MKLTKEDIKKIKRMDTKTSDEMCPALFIPCDTCPIYCRTKGGERCVEAVRRLKREIEINEAIEELLDGSK